MDLYFEQMLSEGVNLNGEYSVATAMAKVAVGKPGGQPGNTNAVKGDDENEGDIITVVSDRGTSSEYTIRRLMKEKRQDLVDQIKAGDISANAAAIEAGFRKKYYQIEATREAVIADSTEVKRITVKTWIDGFVNSLTAKELTKSTHSEESYNPPIYNVWKQQKTVSLWIAKFAESLTAKESAKSEEFTGYCAGAAGGNVSTRKHSISAAGA